jgi:hypothetical protein
MELTRITRTIRYSKPLKNRASGDHAGQSITPPYALYVRLRKAPSH